MSSKTIKKAKYSLTPSGEFVIESYNQAKPFANFFPGIAGKYGIPMWVFYVNRGQGICSFGTKDKDHSIFEFFPANKAWQLVSSHGFRTFIKVMGKKPHFYEPFHNGFASLPYAIENQMRITSYDLKIIEDNLTLGLTTTVEYFNIPHEIYAGLARIVTIKNTSRASKEIQLLDGAPQIIPFGTANLFLKKLGRTIEAWMHVQNLDQNVPFYKLDVDPTDRPEVIHINEGNFYLSFHDEKLKTRIIKPIVDPEHIFGNVTDFSYPSKFLECNNFKSPKEEIVVSKTPCAFLNLKVTLKSQEEKTFYSLIGTMRSCSMLNASIARIAQTEYLSLKREENRALIATLQEDIATNSSSRVFDLYAKQTYLDNILRGGYPVILGSQDGQSTFYLYSRKHGDLERDYNKFQIEPTYLSQGNGNYRDINQNRRMDVWFNPETKEKNIITFFNLLQADGFNPLVVKGAQFSLKDPKGIRLSLLKLFDERDLSLLLTFLNQPFTPGEVIFFLEEHNIKPRCSYDELINIIISQSLDSHEAEHGEGFWIDHWHYNLDLLESYFGIFPEAFNELLFENKEFTFFDNAEVVRPRSEKYILYNGLPRQLHAVGLDSAKKELIHKRNSHAHLARTQFGKGEIYYTTLINKLVSLAVNKLASLDPSGAGIEMEANKPNWYDSLNGLPALFGSSLCETFELKRLLKLILGALKATEKDALILSEEIYSFLGSLHKLMEEYFTTLDDFSWWDESYALKEEYRLKTRLGFSGNDISIETARVRDFLELALKKVQRSIESGRDKKTGVYYSYFIHEVVEYETTKDRYIKPTKFIKKTLPLFLEGQMHALRLAETGAEAKLLHQATLKSELYDRKLKMYKVTAPLASQPEEIGRCRVFTPGWLENESIWLHMEYKYLLETLKQGLNKEFYSDLKNSLIAFQPAERYGRNILENSSFLVSSAFADAELHGNGYVARLSGSTAEFLQIWLIMNVGLNPFFLSSKQELSLTFKPVLAGWLFDKKGLYSFKFLSKIKVTYHNPKKKNTFGKDGVKIREIVFADKSGKHIEINTDTLSSPYAQQVRSREIPSLDIYLD